MSFETLPHSAEDRSSQPDGTNSADNNTQSAQAPALPDKSIGARGDVQGVRASHLQVLLLGVTKVSFPAKHRHLRLRACVQSTRFSLGGRHKGSARQKPSVKRVSENGTYDSSSDSSDSELGDDEGSSGKPHSRAGRGQGVVRLDYRLGSGNAVSLSAAPRVVMHSLLAQPTAGSLICDNYPGIHTFTGARVCLQPTQMSCAAQVGSWLSYAGSRLRFWPSRSKRQVQHLARKLSENLNQQDATPTSVRQPGIPKLTIVMLVTGTRGDVQVSPSTLCWRASDCLIPMTLQSTAALRASSAAEQTDVSSHSAAVLCTPSAAE